MVARSGVPFSVGGRVVARSRDQLGGMFEAMAEEAGDERDGPVKVLTASGFRKAFGAVPAGMAAGTGRLFAGVAVGGDTFVLVLDKRFGAWRITGLTR